jgi:putative colanic acid biosynthesis UDP-glucose lipid carrier transferase
MSVPSVEHDTRRHVQSEHIVQLRRSTAAVARRRPLRADVSADSRAKRLCDIVVALVLGVGALPLMVIIAALIKADSRGPVLYRQLRCGRNQKPFVIFKFRTMEAHASSDGRQATRDDRRVTKIGRFLRKSSLDELPQIYNVLRGDMSLVGPRPHALWHDELFCDMVEGYRDRYLVKPGITGLAQITGCRGETGSKAEMQRRVEKDLEYIEKRSLGLDLKILLLTLPSLLWLCDAY